MSQDINMQSRDCEEQMADLLNVYKSFSYLK